MPEKSPDVIRGLYELAKAGNWSRVLAALAGERELAASCSRYRRASSGWTFLHQAAYSGHEDAARAFIRLGASATARAKDGETPEAVAERQGHRDLSRLLRNAAQTADSSWEAPADPALLPSSCAWEGSARRTAARELRVAYAGAVIVIPPGARYHVDSFERVLVGWHGTYDPPSGMDGESMISA
ncbi:MAG: hypothetical protein QM704_12450 [Anaeromyxobacteraceae bacterium]